MASHNSVTLMGNLTRDPELRHTPNGMSVASFGLAINRQTKGGEEVTFVDITVWDKQAETAAQFLKKGRLVLIEGRLRQEKWEDKNGGGTRSKLVVVAERVTFLPSGNGNGAPAELAGVVASADEEVPF
jgi:single-strand DNA-binding protein